MENALGEPQTIVLLGGTQRHRSGHRLGAGVALDPDRRAGRPPTRRGRRRRRSPGRGWTVDIVAFDATDSASHEAFVRGPRRRHGDLDVVIVAFGQLGEQAELDDDPAAAAELVHVNYTGAVSVGLAVAAQFRRQGHGRLVVLSSVAGERVRKANFVYGSSKAGLDGFAQGLGDALAGTGASVLVVRPGFVHSRMTAGMKAAPVRHHAGRGRRGHGRRRCARAADGLGAGHAAPDVRRLPPPARPRLAPPPARLTALTSSQARSVAECSTLGASLGTGNDSRGRGGQRQRR